MNSMKDFSFSLKKRFLAAKLRAWGDAVLGYARHLVSPDNSLF